MVDQQVTMTKVPALDEVAVQKFKANLRGELIRPEDTGYDDAQCCWQCSLRRRHSYRSLPNERNSHRSGQINCTCR
ncbi:MAG: hypothetical protein OIN83_08795 [Candidatus Methanoperedens sp.]|nr:hypothetical protein [Candidatus Methanoperedens sp.]